MKVLFLCKDRNISYKDGKYGLWNSANFVVTFLQSLGVFAKLVSVFDANSINKEVTNFKPDTVVLEALWVTPEKLKELQSIHPMVEWVARIHSKATFLANEGIAVDWMNAYSELKNVVLSVNNDEFNEDLRRLGYDSVCLPNIYLFDKKRTKLPGLKQYIHIGCFGSLRPMKNHLNQAIAAIRYADEIGKKLCFHINSTRSEQNGGNVLKNLRALFDYQRSRHSLVEHPWMSHDEFLDLLSQVDISMQCSLSESFNIVTADAISQNVPVVTSPEINFVSSLFTANPVDTNEMIGALYNARYAGMVGLQRVNEWYLRSNSSLAQARWKMFFGLK